MPAAVAIGSRRIGPGNATYIIAEAGVNHDGDPALAHRLVEIAASAGADAVKFQTFSADALAARDAPRAAYQMGRLGGADGQHAMLKALELPKTVWLELKQHAAERGIDFLSTPFDEGSLDLLLALGVPAIKIGSGDLTHLGLLRRAAAAGLPLLCSTGMATLGEVARAVEVVRAEGGAVALLHCVSSYPAPDETANLRAIMTLKRVFDVPVGYSDHTLGIRVAIAAVAAGADLLEKHFTSDPSLPGPDHRASLEAAELTAMVADIRAVEGALGDGRKWPRPEELETRRVARRGLVWSRDLMAGHVVEWSDLTAMRPAQGLAADRAALIIGGRLRHDVSAGAFVRPQDLD